MSTSTQVKGDKLEYNVKEKFEEINVIVHGVKCLHRVTYYISISQIHSMAPDIYLREGVEAMYIALVFSRETAFIWCFMATHGVAILVTSDNVGSLIGQSLVVLVYKGHTVFCAAARTSYKTNKGNIITGDGGADLIGEYRNVKFIVQCKNFTNDKVHPSLIRDFIRTLSKYSTGTFVTTVGYTKSSFEEAENSDYDIILTDLSNLIKKFTSYINKRTKRRSSNDDNEFITIESAEFENIEVEEDATLSIFGIEIKGKHVQQSA
ncbi:hypothetical protein RclHR1_02440004 [Rhizophagus clarus]|uniref:Restriction endonuclease type IV Mrr domain-containing protein n=1 Tax=Rhizophagus clarus TaxID=94130 RepID=A0A2Z6QXW9_9GLOM|nr:hypothetical protein RclHR1_02440004 [Rhizophagus clarus]